VTVLAALIGTGVLVHQNEPDLIQRRSCANCCDESRAAAEPSAPPTPPAAPPARPRPPEEKTAVVPVLAPGRRQTGLGLSGECVSLNGAVAVKRMSSRAMQQHGNRDLFRQVDRRRTRADTRRRADRAPGIIVLPGSFPTTILAGVHAHTQ